MKNEYLIRKTIEFNTKWKLILKCNECGSNGSTSKRGISYHHLDPSTKEFNINYRDCVGKSYIEIQTEINKCIPLCPSCHAKFHHPKIIIDIKKYTLEYREKHKEKMKDYQKTYYEKNKEKLKLYQKNYRENH